MKKKAAAVICAALAALMPCAVFADGVNVYYNEKLISFPNTQPSIVDGRTLVPLRGVFDAMGYDVEWDSEERAAYLSKGDVIIETSEVEMILNSPSESKEIVCEVMPRIIGGSFMIPLRAVSEATGAEVEWDSETRSVYITSEEDTDFGEDSKEDNIEGTMSVDEKEYLSTLKECTDYIFDFASEKDDTVLKALLFEYNIEIEGNITVPSGYYDGIQEKIEVLKKLDPPDSMSRVHDCVFAYLDEMQKAINGVSAGTYGAADIEKSSQILRENSEQYGVLLYNYFNENKVSFEQLYGAEILDALKRN